MGAITVTAAVGPMVVHVMVLLLLLLLLEHLLVLMLQVLLVMQRGLLIDLDPVGLGAPVLEPDLERGNMGESAMNGTRSARTPACRRDCHIPGSLG